MPCYQIDGVTPVVHPSAYVHPTAVLIGDVHVGANCYVGPGASLRGDFGRIVMEAGSNLQDSCVVHAFPGRDAIVRRNGHVGHGAILHGCTIEEDAMVGMNSVIMDEAVIAARSIVGACAFVKAGFECEPASLIVGSPAKVLRQLSDKEVGWKQSGTREYQALTERCLETIKECAPLTEIDENRPQLRVGAHNLKDR
ncbi:phenylacetic acid degradation protein PaaY [Marinobacter sp. M3C]|uniref:phenylacetic acid degradation protein PaaY n=1 Tax=Marinobacter sp. M3C TaxID=2917715 RepID=UPI00200BC7BB|nr:phenylacetic acid degradation protein PaaY [Marinobacter sp. M3C]MCL1480389.1 phenylacetic acid degradation protein PaaY [Marinobacter sp.]MCL1483749.1 phenylacetic acid degradation protein PaaY [Marinobacter sp.]UQG59241.1 phenylacetic acid degradation protein PaaY [Marinobacter sp. M3C]